MGSGRRHLAVSSAEALQSWESGAKFRQLTDVSWAMIGSSGWISSSKGPVSERDKEKRRMVRSEPALKTVIDVLLSSSVWPIPLPTSSACSCRSPSSLESVGRSARASNPPVVCPVRRSCSLSPPFTSQSTSALSAPPLSSNSLPPWGSEMVRRHFTKSVWPPRSLFVGSRVLNDQECMLLSHDPAKMVLEVRAREVRGAIDAGERKVSDLEVVCWTQC